MISVQTAESLILQQAFPVRPEQVPFQRARGRVLAENLYADRDFPPFDRVTMDGIALRFERFEAGQRHFRIAGVQAAGSPAMPLPDPNACMEVMTGAMLPPGCDTVLRYEDIQVEDGWATLHTETVVPGQNLHVQGIDKKAGALLLSAGQPIGPAEIATIATIGRSTVLVAALPRVAIVSTGDELVDVDAQPLPHQIRRSNSHALAALLAHWYGVESSLHHFPDDEAQIAAGLGALLPTCEVLVLSGAVSAGKFDFVPAVLERLGVVQAFHKVAQRPGKPFWFGYAPTGAVVFALPGNPVSAFLCACRYLHPFVQRCLGAAPVPQTAVLAEALRFKPALTYFVPVRIDRRPDGVLYALPLPGHGSGDLANLNEADAFMELPAERESFVAGEVFPVFFYR